MQALYYWLRTYLLERRDVANKSEYGRIAMAQRMQQSVSGVGTTGSIGLADGSARVQGGSAMVSENQPAGSIGSHDGNSSQGQEGERSATAEGVMASGNDQSLHQSTSNNEGQNALRRNGAMGLVASAASAFDAAKDIMETLRSKHNNLASELEVLLRFFLSWYPFLSSLWESIICFSASS